jgi:regulator of RNase E activity RraA
VPSAAAILFDFAGALLAPNAHYRRTDGVVAAAAAADVAAAAEMNTTTTMHDARNWTASIAQQKPAIEHLDATVR